MEGTVSPGALPASERLSLGKEKKIPWWMKAPSIPFSHLHFMFRSQEMKDIILLYLPPCSAVLPHAASRNPFLFHPETSGCSVPIHHGSHYWNCLHTLFSTIIDQTRAFDPLCFGQQMVRIKYLLRLHLKDTLLSLAFTCALSNKLQLSLSKGVKAKEWCLTNCLFMYWYSLGTKKAGLCQDSS